MLANWWIQTKALMSYSI
uniref:Uncharacterized protein n=1 Tax=Rhizophora mucronata TaxID=61149 RepID=A0A2P2P8M4_RHIMU